MMTELEAIYRRGTLELKSLLPVKEGEVVRVVVMTGEEVSLQDRVATMHKVADAWLAQQPVQAIPSMPDYPQEEWVRLDAELDKVLAEIEQKSARYTEEEVAADVEAAVKATRKQKRQRKKKK
jgi:predicted DNA-binding antitoxin AbrB/MazE fold protein